MTEQDSFNHTHVYASICEYVIKNISRDLILDTSKYTPVVWLNLIICWVF